MIERFLTTEQVANILQVHPFTILKFIKQGKLKGIKLGRVYRIQESEVKRFLEDRSANHHKMVVKTIQDPEDDQSPELEADSEFQISKPESSKTPPTESDGKDHYII